MDVSNTNRPKRQGYMRDYLGRLISADHEFKMRLVMLESIERINKRIIREWDRVGEGEFKQFIRERWWQLAQSN